MSIKPRRGARQRGLTLIELIIFIVIVGVAVVGVLQVITLNTRSSADPARRKQAMAIAEGLMEEVRLAGFTLCDINDPAVETAKTAADCTSMPEVAGPEAGNTTRPYDNVNDYVNAFGTPKAYASDVIGNAFPAGYAATVNIIPDGMGPPGAPIVSDASTAGMNALRITVTVTYGSDNVVLESYRTRYAPNNVPISSGAP
jgi:MSHA pilin protein MshD